MQHAWPATACSGGARSKALLLRSPMTCMVPASCSAHLRAARTLPLPASWNYSPRLRAHGCSFCVRQPALRVGAWPTLLRSHSLASRRGLTCRAETSEIEGSTEAPTSVRNPKPPRGRPLVTPNAYVAAFAFFGVGLTLFAGFAPESMQPVPRLMAFLVLQQQGIAFKVALLALLVHVFEAVGVCIVGQRRGYDAKSIVWWAAMAFLFGYPGIYAMNEVDRGELDESSGGPRFKLE